MKKIVALIVLIIGATTFLSACSWLPSPGSGSATQTPDQDANQLDQETPLNPGQEGNPTQSNASDVEPSAENVESLETELNNIKLEEETFQ